MKIRRMKIVFLPEQYGCSKANFKSRIVKRLYLQNKNVLEAPILSGLYWEYIRFFGNIDWHIYNLARIGGYVPLNQDMLAKSLLPKKGIGSKLDMKT